VSERIRAQRLRDEAWGWSFFEDGGLALDRHELWEEPETESALRVSQSSGLRRLKAHGPFDTVGRDMPSSRPTRRRRVERREVRAARRARNFALLVILAIVLVVALLLTAFGGGSNGGLAPLAATGIATADAQTSPYPQVVAVRGAVRLQMPIAQNAVTAIGYHAADDGAMTLSPIGHQGNEGVVQRVVHAIFGGGGGHPTWFQLGGGTTSALDVGAAPGTGVYSPVDGTVVGISPYIVGGRHYGAQIDIQPQSAPSLVVSLTQLRADPSLTVGASVVGGATRIGSVVDLARIEKQALARYTNDAGNHVTVELRPAATLVLH
jgi:hypothetical protein